MVPRCLAFPVLGLALLMSGCTSSLGRPPMGQSPLQESQSQAAPDAKKPKLLFEERDLAGVYYQGDGLGTNLVLVLAEDHRVGFAWYGCLGGGDKNGGTWSLDGDVVVLRLAEPDGPEGLRRIDARFVPVKWGERVYLVEEDQMPAFCVGLREKDIPFRSEPQCAS